MPPDTRDAVVDFVNRWSEKAEIPAGWFIPWLGIRPSKYYHWSKRYGKVNEHNGWIPRDYWLEDWEKQAIIAFHLDHPLEGYRRLTFMMLDADVVAVSPTSVWRVLSGAGLLRRWNVQPSKKGTGFVPPLGPHEHWHVDVCYLNLGGTFYYLCSVLDGYSHTRNRGIAFGLLHDLGPVAYAALLAGVVVIIVFVGRQLFRSGADGLTATALSLVLGGALGNLGDRLLRGEVVDFLHVFVTVGGQERHWPAFNVADAAITVGAILIVLAELLLARERRHAPHAD